MEFCLQQAGGRKACAHSGIVNNGKKNPVGPGRFLSALEDGAVAALEAECGDLDHGVGARLEDHADNSDRNTDALQNQIRIEFPAQEPATDRIGKSDQLLDSLADIGELGLIEKKPLHDGGGDPVFLRCPAVFRIGGEDFIFSGDEFCGDGAERCIPGLV